MTKTPGTPSQDLQLRFLLPDAGVRGVAVHLDETWANMVAHATYPPAAAELLGEAAAAAALFTGHAKVDGRLSVQLRADGAIRTLFAECTAAGTLRGIVRLDEAVADGRAAPPSRDLRALGEDAVLAITIENPALGSREPMRYQGLVALDADRLDEAFEAYSRAAAAGHAAALLEQGRMLMYGVGTTADIARAVQAFELVFHRSGCNALFTNVLHMRQAHAGAAERAATGGGQAQ